jgi:hypothetical protein
MEKKESILGDVTEVLDIWLQPPVPFVLHQERVLVEEPNHTTSAKDPTRPNQEERRTLNRTGTCGDNSPCRHT